MKYTTLFEIERFTVEPIHIMLIGLCVLLIGFVYYTHKHEKSKTNRVMSIVVAIVFVFISGYVIVGYNMESIELYNMLKTQDCLVVQGEVESFHTPTVAGHDSESFYIDDVYFEYSDSVTVGYSKTKSFGGCIKGNGQKLRISYASIDGMNIILKIEQQDGQLNDRPACLLCKSEV